MRLSKLLLIPLCTLAVATGAAAQERRSHVEIPEKIFNFGTVAQGTTVRHDFIVRNTGNADLAIQRVVAACGCTATTTSAPVVPAGQQATIHVDFDTNGISGDKLKTVRVYTNDLDDPSTILSLKGVIEPNVTVQPSRISFGQVVSGGAPSSSEFTIKTRADSKLKIAEVESLSPQLELQQLSGTDEERRYKVTLKSELPIGDFRERVVATLKGDKTTTINIPVFATVTGPVRLESDTLSFGVIEGKAPLKRQVKIENLSTKPVSIRNVKSAHPAITTSVTTIKPGFIYVLAIEVDPTKVSKDLRDALEVTTDASDEPMLLTVYGILPPKVQ